MECYAHSSAWKIIYLKMKMTIDIIKIITKKIRCKKCDAINDVRVKCDREGFGYAVFTCWYCGWKYNYCQKLEWIM